MHHFRSSFGNEEIINIFAGQLASNYWNFYYSPTPVFYTSRFPIVVSPHVPNARPLCLGLTQYGAELSFPISPNIVLVIWEKDYFKEKASTDGNIVVATDEDIRKYNRRDYYALFTAVFQQLSILDATVEENVAQDVENIDEAKVCACLSFAGLAEDVETLPKGLKTNLGRRIYEDGVELSGGQQQRLMLARALYKNAPILVLDEPTAALDPIAESDMYSKYNEMTRGRTSVFISHRLASTRFCDRIILLSDGVIAEEGTHESLVEKNGTYTALFNVQSKYYAEGGEENGKEDLL